MVRALRIFAYVWFGLVIFANVLAVIGMIATAPDFRAGLGRVQDTYSPFNVTNVIIELISLSPGLLAYAVARHLSRRA